MSLLAQDERLTRRVGAITLVLLVVAASFFVFVWRRLDGGPHVRVRVYFTRTGGLVEGAPFVVAGREIGRVESIALSPRGASSPLAGEEGVVVTVRVDQGRAGMASHAGDVFVSSRGLFSSRQLELAPPPGEPGRGLVDGDRLRGRDPPSIDRVLQRTLENLTITKRFVDEIRPELRALSAAVDELVATVVSLVPDALASADLARVVDEGRRAYAALGGAVGTDRVRALFGLADQTFARARAEIAALRAGADALAASLRALRARSDGRGALATARIELAIERGQAALARVDRLLALVAELEAGVARGDGSLLKLLRDPEFPEDAKELGKVIKRQPWRLLDRPAR